MRYLWIVVMIILIAGCARVQYVAAPNPDEVSSITYQINSRQDSQTWHFVNNNLTVRYTKRTKNRRVISDKLRKVTPNDFNWLVTEIEKANYTRINPPSKLANSSYIGRPNHPSSRASEFFIIENLGGSYTFQRLGNIRLPNELEALGKQIPSIFK